MPAPNRTFFLLVVLSVALIGAIGWSAHHLLLAGAPALAMGGSWPGVSCVLFPSEGDIVVHLASYVFLGAIVAGTARGLRTLVRQHRQTKTLLRTCLAARSPRRRSVTTLARRLGLDERLDLVLLSRPLAFCYGYLRPRVLISIGLVATLPQPELEALLLHEREHLRQRDPLKVAVGRLFASALFFVPAANVLNQRYLVEKELAADRAAIAELGESATLASALVRFLDGTARTGPLLAAGSDEALGSRIDALVGEPVEPGRDLHLARHLGTLAVLLVAIAPLIAPWLLAELSMTGQNLLAGCHFA